MVSATGEKKKTVKLVNIGIFVPINSGVLWLCMVLVQVLLGLGALSVQYKHLTEAMTLYYRDNAVFAPNILASESQKEFIQELEYQRLVHSYAQFEDGVINSSSRLLGGAGTYLQLQKDREQLLKVFPNRDETIKRMKKGKLPISLVFLVLVPTLILAKKFLLRRLPVA